MLVLSRKPQEIVRIGDSVVVQVLSMEGNNVRIGITAPPDVKVLRKELLDRQKKAEARRIRDVQQTILDLVRPLQNRICPVLPFQPVRRFGDAHDVRRHLRIEMR